MATASKWSLARRAPSEIRSRLELIRTVGFRTVGCHKEETQEESEGA